jgi:Tfp pilus assembly protein PilF
MTSEYPEVTTPLGRKAETLYQQGFDAYQQQQVVEARRLLEQSLSLFRQAEHTPGILRSQHILANIAFSEGQYILAQTLHEDVLAACRAMNFQEGIASSLNNLGLIAAKQGMIAEGCALLEDSIRIYEDLGHSQEATAARANLESLQRSA